MRGRECLSILALLLPQMKKGLLITIAAFYLLATVGIHLHIHYCCGKVADVTLFGGNDGCCKHHGEDATCHLQKKCCTFSEVDFKVDEAHTVPAFTEVSATAIAHPTFHWTVSNTHSVVVSKARLLPRSQAPPDDTPAFLRFQSLLFYA